jgi:hypothetical protein
VHPSVALKSYVFRPRQADRPGHRAYFRDRQALWRLLRGGCFERRSGYFVRDQPIYAPFGLAFDKIRDRVAIDRSEHPNAEEFEKKWITDYITERDSWLASIPRLAATRYRTRLFLNLIKNANWNLDLPIRVQGELLTDATFSTDSTAAPVVQPTTTGDVPVAIPNTNLSPPEIGPPSTLVSRFSTWLFGR